MGIYLPEARRNRGERHGRSSLNRRQYIIPSTAHPIFLMKPVWLLHYRKGVWLAYWTWLEIGRTDSSIYTSWFQKV